MRARRKKREGARLTSSVVVGIEHGKESANAEDIVVLDELHLGG
jgi:hypothetical protein